MLAAGLSLSWFRDALGGGVAAARRVGRDPYVLLTAEAERVGPGSAGELGVRVETVLSVGGGARSRLWRQIQTDVYGMPVWSLSGEEHSACGPALVAGVAAGVYRGTSWTPAAGHSRPSGDVNQALHRSGTTKHVF